MNAKSLLGRLVAGRYEIESSIGSGGMAEVYRAYDRESKDDVALKVFTEADAGTKRRFLEEARTLARLTHPSIVTVHACGEDDDLSYIAMELAPGEDLRAWRARGTTVGFVLRAIANVLTALAFAHERDVLHRDIKPTNILATSQADIKLMDFGLSRRISDLSAGTHAGEIVGTVAYLPPERFLGKMSDERGDLYSLGVVLYELLTGVPPFRSDTDDLVAVIFAHLNEAPASPQSLGAPIDEALERYVLRLLEKSPSARPRTAAIARDELRGYIMRHPQTERAPLGAPADGG